MLEPKTSLVEAVEELEEAEHLYLIAQVGSFNVLVNIYSCFIVIAFTICGMWPARLELLAPNCKGLKHLDIVMHRPRDFATRMLVVVRIGRSCFLSTCGGLHGEHR